MMTRSVSCLVLGLVATSATAQEAQLKIVPAKTNVLRYTIELKTELKTDTKRRIDGEERTNRRGGGGGPVQSIQKLVFDEGPAGTGWRQYITATASVTRPGRQGEENATNKIVAAVAGKKFFISTEEGRVVLKEGKPDGKAIPRQSANGIPANVDLSGLITSKPVEVKAEYELGSGFVTALKNLLHPVRAARQPRGEGQGGRGAGQRGGRQGRGGRRRGGNTQTLQNKILRILGSAKIETKGQGQLLSIEETDGHKLATVSLKAEITAKGDPIEIGLAAPRRNRRGGGDGQAQAQAKGNGSLTLVVSGTMIVDLTENRVASLDLEGTLESMSETTRTTSRNGTDRKIETTQTSTGKFTLKVACANQGAPKKNP